MDLWCLEFEICCAKEYHIPITMINTTDKTRNPLIISIRHFTINNIFGNELNGKRSQVIT